MERCRKEVMLKCFYFLNVRNLSANYIPHRGSEVFLFTSALMRRSPVSLEPISVLQLAQETLSQNWAF
jgi:hypothetical protein